MADVKQILVVDDHFEMLEFLRSMLELSNRDYQVLGVPSAEEGFLELRRTPFDLLITDVRLPGMSGFELVRKVRHVQPELPIIMITAYSSPKGKQEAEELNVFRYFAKPLDTDALLAAVHTTLYEEQAEADASMRAVDAQKRDDATENVVRNRMQNLMSDTGAAQVVLADRQGTIRYRVGERRAVDLERLARTVAGSLDNSFTIAEQLESEEPFTIQYQAGQKVDLYTANIGQAYFIMLLFDVQARRGRIGTIWIFAQRAIKDLHEMLIASEAEAEVSIVEDVEEMPLPAQPLEPEVAEVEELQLAVDGDSEQWDAFIEVDEERVGDTAPLPSLDDEEQVDDEPETTQDDSADINFLEDLPQADDIDLDAFWDDATDGAENADNMTGLSYEEALRRGLLPPEFDNSED